MKELGCLYVLFINNLHQSGRMEKYIQLITVLLFEEALHCDPIYRKLPVVLHVLKKCVKRGLTEIQTKVGRVALERYQTLQRLARALSLMCAEPLVCPRTSSLPFYLQIKENSRWGGGKEVAGEGLLGAWPCIECSTFLLKSPLTSEVDAAPLRLPNTSEEPEAQRLRNSQGHAVGKQQGQDLGLGLPTQRCCLWGQGRTPPLPDSTLG